MKNVSHIFLMLRQKNLKNADKIPNSGTEHGKIEIRGVFPVFPGPCPSLREGNNGYAGLNRDVQKRRKLFLRLDFSRFPL